MLSIGVMGAGQENYYLALAQEDYYLKGGEPSGIWHGDGAASLDLTGVVDADDFRALMRGYSPRGVALVQNAVKKKRKKKKKTEKEDRDKDDRDDDDRDNENGAKPSKNKPKRKKKKQRDPGWDLTFSVPKSVSVLWAMADEALRKRIQDLIEKAFQKAIAYLEAEATYCRMGKGGKEKVKAKLAVAAFVHGTSRALDPQYHIHGLVLNAGLCPDGKYRALSSIDLFRHKMAAGAFFRTALAHELQEELGVKIIRPKNKKGDSESWFEIDGVDESLMQTFSKRRAEIKALLGKLGLESAAAAAAATKETRKKKRYIPPRPELFTIWQEEGRRHGFTQATIGQILGRVNKASPRKQSRRYQKALHEAVAQITGSEGHFTELELLRRTLEAAQGWGLEPDFVKESVRRDIRNPDKFVELGEVDHKTRYTSKEVMATEKFLLDSVDKLHESDFQPVDADIVESIIASPHYPGVKGFAEKLKAKAGLLGKGVRLNEEQSKALRHLTQSDGRIKVLNGLAGTGKTTLLSAMEEAYSRQGYRVIGCSVAGVAAQGLQTGAGIESDTVAMRLQQLSPSLAWTLNHHARQLWRATRGHRTSWLNRLKIDRSTVLVVDEAGMLSTQDFAELARAVVKGGGIMVCVGDHRQLPSIGPGGGFEFVANRVGQVDLAEIGRQTDHIHRELVKALARGDARLALTLFAECGQLRVTKTQDKTAETLIVDWKKHGGIEQPKDHVIVVATNREVTRYNELAQRERMQAGKLDLTQQVKVREEILYPGDRVIFTTKSRKLGVENGDRGVLTAVKPWGIGTTVAVQLDRTKEVVLIPVQQAIGESFQGLQRGYAFTTHKLQGATVEHSYIHIGGSMTTREMAYVQASRHRETVRLYTEELEAGRELTKIARDYARQELKREQDRQRQQERQEERRQEPEREKSQEHQRQGWLSSEKLPIIERERENKVELEQVRDTMHEVEQKLNARRLEQRQQEQKAEQEQVREKPSRVEQEREHKPVQQPQQERDKEPRQSCDQSQEKLSTVERKHPAESIQQPKQEHREERIQTPGQELKVELEPSWKNRPEVERQQPREQSPKVEQSPQPELRQPPKQEPKVDREQARENQQKVEPEKKQEPLQQPKQERKESHDKAQESLQKSLPEQKPEALQQLWQKRMHKLDQEKEKPPLVQQMEESKAKKLAHEIMAEAQRQREEQQQALDRNIRR